jgi:hypothetical protein
MFAAGLPRGTACGRDMTTCGRLGPQVAAEVIPCLGARQMVLLAALEREKEIVV